MSAVTTTRRPANTPAVPTVSRNPLALLRQETDELINRFFNGNHEGWLGGIFSPSVDLTESDNAFEVRMDVPGLEPKDINVQVSGNTVTLSGERKQEHEEKGKTYHQIERHYGSFSRTITLPCKVNDDEVAADYSKGVLTVKLPKCEEARAKKVAVKTS